MFFQRKKIMAHDIIFHNLYLKMCLKRPHTLLKWWKYSSNITFNHYKPMILIQDTFIKYPLFWGTGISETKTSSVLYSFLIELLIKWSLRCIKKDFQKALRDGNLTEESKVWVINFCCVVNFNNILYFNIH